MSQIVTFQLRRGTEAGPTGWAAVNTTLSQGEPGLATDTGVLKIGDGQTKWKDLPITSQSYSDIITPISIGNSAGGNDATVSIGGGAGSTGQGEYSVAIGLLAGQKNQGIASVAFGVYAAQENQGVSSVALGTGAGQFNQGKQSIALGAGAGNINQPDHTIILNANSIDLNGVAGQTGSFYVDPIREAGASYSLMYNTSTKEISYTNVSTGPTGPTGPAGPGGPTGPTGPGGDASKWAEYPASANVDMGGFDITNCISLSCTKISTGVNGGVSTPSIFLSSGISGDETTAGRIVMSDVTGAQYTLESGSGNLFFDGQTLARVIDIQNISDWSKYPAVSDVDMKSRGVTGASFVTTQTISSDGTFGSSGQYLSSDGSKIVWADIPSSQYNSSTPPTSISIAPTFSPSSFVNQGNDCIAFGTGAGSTNQNQGAIAFGSGAGGTNQGQGAIAFGAGAGGTGQGDDCIAFGNGAGNTDQKIGAIAIGGYAGNNGQNGGAIALGSEAGYTGQGFSSLAIGNYAGRTNQAANSIILNATGGDLDGVSGQTGSFYVAPIRKDLTITTPLFYDPATHEIVYGTSGVGDPEGPSPTISVPSNSILWSSDGTSVTGTTGLQYSSGVGITMDVLNIQSLSNRVSIGRGSGKTNQGVQATAIGFGAGNTGQGIQATAIGFSAGNTGQGIQATAIGAGAGSNGQRDYSVAIGAVSGSSNQGIQATAVGTGAGSVDQGDNAVAVGRNAGTNTQGANSVAIGAFAGQTDQAANTIILNASGVALNGNPGVTGGFYVAPIRQDLTITAPLFYDPSTHEIVYGTSGVGGPEVPVGPEVSPGTGPTISVPSNSILWSSDGTSVTGTTGLQYSSGVGITMDVLNIQGSPYPANIRIGYAAGQGGQGDYAVAIGLNSGNNQGEASVAIGNGAGQTDQGQNSVAIGRSSGQINQGANSIAIGALAGDEDQADNTIILNASGVAVNGNVGVAGCFYVKPIRTDLTQTSPLCYNSTTGEIVIGSRTTTGSWTLAVGANNVSIRLPGPGTYSIWVNGNIPNGIVTYTATVVVTNPNVPALGSQYGWHYAAGGALVLTSLPIQVVGTAGGISNAVPVPLAIDTHVFTFGITNNTAAFQEVNWGYTTL